MLNLPDDTLKLDLCTVIFIKANYGFTDSLFTIGLT